MFKQLTVRYLTNAQSAAPLQRSKTTPNECPGYDTKQSDGEVPGILELWGMRSTSLLSSLPGPLWPGVVAPDKGPINGLNRTKRWLAFIAFIHLNCVLMLNWIARNRTVLTSKLRTYAELNYLKLNCLTFNAVYCPVGWGCRIHWLHLCRGVTPPQWVSWIWH